MTIVNFLFIRHAESEANVNPDIRLRESYDDMSVPLTEQGRLQAEQCRLTLLERYDIGKNGDSTIYYTSPMKRAKETVAMILQKSTQHARQDDRLKEQDIPKFQTASERDYHRGRAKEQGKYFYRYPNGECGEDVAGRLQSFVHDLLQKTGTLSTDSQNIVIVTHEVVIRAAIFILSEDEKKTEVFDHVDIQNCQIIRFSMTIR